MKVLKVPMDLLKGPIWNNDKPYSEAQAYIQFYKWASDMGGETKFIHGNMVTLKDNEFIMPQRKIAESINWPQSAVSRFLKKLVTLNQCRIKTESKMTRVTLNIVVDTPNPESMLTQSRINDDSLYDSFLGGRTNSNNSNNYNIINNNNIDKNTNTSNNSNIYTKPIKNSNIGVGSRVKKYTAKPKDLQMVKDYFLEKDIPIQEAETFWNYYEMTGWFTGKTKIKNWRMAVANWKRRMKDQPKKVSQAEDFKTGPLGDILVYCHNPKCQYYNQTQFAQNKWDIKKGCTCGYDFHPTRIKRDEVAYENSETKESQERQAWSEESTTRRRTTEGSGESLQDIFSGMFQSGPRGR